MAKETLGSSAQLTSGAATLGFLPALAGARVLATRNLNTTIGGEMNQEQLLKKKVREGSATLEEMWQLFWIRVG